VSSGRPPAEPTPPAPPDPVEAHPLARRIRRAIQAHPVLRDEKKLVVTVKQGTARVEGTVFTRNMHRQLAELVAQVAGDEPVDFAATPQIQAPQDRALEGRVPPVSEGPSSVKRDFSVGHLRRPKR
jgi:hypothetical protein